MKKVRILSIDGGGIRGVIPATILTYVEKKLQKLTDNHKTRLGDYFDMIVGTSTGGILACFYLVPGNSEKGPSTRFTADEALKFYEEEGYSIFNQSRRNSWWGLRGLFNATGFEAKRIEYIFHREFGDLKMNQLLKKCLVPTYCMDYQLKGNTDKSKSAFFFSSKDHISERDFYVKDVVRSTSAAPTFFTPAKIKNLADGAVMTNIDGGVFANNPSMCAYSEARNTNFDHIEFPTAKDMMILSIGTGGGRFDLPPIERSSRWSVLNWARAIPNIMMDGGFDTVNHQMQNLFGTLDAEDVLNFKRIDVAPEDRIYAPDMADASKKNIENLKAAAHKTIQKAQKAAHHSRPLDEFIRQLIINDPKTGITEKTND